MEAKVKLIRSIKFDSTQENQRTFLTVGEQEAYFTNLADPLLSLDDFNFQRYTESMEYPANIDKLLDISYLIKITLSFS